MLSKHPIILIDISKTMEGCINYDCIEKIKDGKIINYKFETESGRKGQKSPLSKLGSSGRRTCQSMHYLEKRWFFLYLQSCDGKSLERMPLTSPGL